MVARDERDAERRGQPSEISDVVRRLDDGAATSVERLRAEPLTRGPRPRGETRRHKGREKVRKYGVVYKFIKQGDVEVAPDDEGGEETCTVHYTPCFGPVPGYKEGATIGAVPVRGPNPHAQGPPEVVVSLVREWEEWRVASVVY